MRARPRRTVELASEPAGAEIEVNGQLAGRTPAKLALPPGRCFLSLTRAGFRPHLAVCPADRTTVTLEPAGKEGLRDQLRDRIATDPAWFLEPLLLETLAAEENAGWVVVLDRDRGGRALKALVFSAAERALKPVEPSRLLDAELDKLSVAVRGLVQRTQHLEAQAIETPLGLPALEARAGDPTLGSAVAFVRRKGSADFLRLGLEARGAGRFSGTLPSLLASDGEWDVEYYVEGRDAHGRGRVPRRRSGGAAALPARGHRDGRGVRQPVALVPVDGAGRRRGGRGRDRRLLRDPLQRRVGQAGAAVKRLAAAVLLALACGCKQPEAQLRLQFPVDVDAGADAGTCHQQTSLKCVNYLQFTAGMGEFSSHCTRVEVRAGRPVRSREGRRGPGGVQAVARHAAADHDRGPARLPRDRLQLVERVPAAPDLLGDDRHGRKDRRLQGPGHRPAGEGDRAVRPAGAVLLPARRRDVRGGLRHLARRVRPRPGRLPVQGAAAGLRRRRRYGRRTRWY